MAFNGETFVFVICKLDLDLSANISVIGNSIKKMLIVHIDPAFFMCDIFICIIFINSS